MHLFTKNFELSKDSVCMCVRERQNDIKTIQHAFPVQHPCSTRIFDISLRLHCLQLSAHYFIHTVTVTVDTD